MKQTKPLTRSQKQRRGLLRSIAIGTAMVGTGLAGYIPLFALAELRLRPPGALKEKDFLASCIKCGQCVQVCPVEAILLADVFDGVGIGVPYIDARNQACDFACDTPQCVLACPTGSLSHDIDRKEQVKMGMAELSRPSDCLARQGKGFKGKARGENSTGLHRYINVDRWNPIKIADYDYDLEICDLCVRECPIKDAISLEKIAGETNKFTPVVHEECVGCGMCEMICPVEPSCITIKEAKSYQDIYGSG